MLMENLAIPEELILDARRVAGAGKVDGHDRRTGNRYTGWKNVGSALEGVSKRMHSV